MKQSFVVNRPVHNFTEQVFNFTARERDYTYEVYKSWKFERIPFAYAKVVSLFTVMAHSQISEYRESFVLDFEQSIVFLDTNRDYVSLQLFGSSFVDNDKAIEKIKEVFVKSPIPENDQIDIKFWYSGSSGPVHINREITVPAWELINSNYNEMTKNSLSYLIDDFKPSAHIGQLILWHGQPGTGKTYALRALLRSWRKWCSGEYILDPEALFGHSPGYLANMLLSGYAGDVYDEDEEEVDLSPVEESEKWRLLILEDTGELLSESAKDRVGQGLSRLLNLVDGMIGQGLKILVLITTNEDFEKLHPAVSRQGRCLASIKFLPFTEDEARKWAKEHKFSLETTKSAYTLAELFSQTKEARPILNNENIKQLGFRIPR